MSTTIFCPGMRNLSSVGTPVFSALGTGCSPQKSTFDLRSMGGFCDASSCDGVLGFCRPEEARLKTDLPEGDCGPASESSTVTSLALLDAVGMSMPSMLDAGCANRDPHAIHYKLRYYRAVPNSSPPMA